MPTSGHRRRLAVQVPDVLKSPAGAANLWKAFADAMKAAKTKPGATAAA
jgi:hypothetical protein